MESYERIWTIIAGTTGAAALTAAFHGWNVLVLGCALVAAGVGGVLVAVPCLRFDARWTRPLVKAFLVSGVGSWVLMGAGRLAGVLGVAVVLVVMLLAPRVLRFFASLSRSPGRRAVLAVFKTWTSSAEISSVDGPAVGTQATSTPPAARPARSAGERPTTEPRAMSDEELCLAWRASYLQLERAPTAKARLDIATLRAGYLDELERRAGPAGHEWLPRGKHAAGDASGLLKKSRTRRARRSVAD